MAIKEVITLEGVTEVEAQLKRLAASGERALGQFNQLGSAADANPFDKLVDGAKAAGLELDNTAKSTVKIGDAMKVLKPVLQATGAEMKELGSLSRLAANNIVAFGAVVAAGAAVAVVSFSESVALLKQRLTDLTGSGAAGSKAFDGLNASAAKLGTTVRASLPGFEGMLSALNAIKARSGGAVFVGFDPVAAQNVETTQKALASLSAILRAAGVDAATADKAIAEFNAELRAGGVVTGQMVQKLTDLAPGAGKLLADAFGQGGKSVANMVVALDKVPDAGEKALQGLGRIGEAAQKAFDDRPVKTLAERTQEGLAAIERALTEQTNRLQTGLVVPPEAQAKMVESMGATGEAAGQSFVAGMNTKLPETESLFQQMYNRAVQIFSTPIPVTFTGTTLGGFGGQLEGAPFAHGGMVRGPGSGTSDSILAWLSNKEYVVNARAVSHYGADLFAALNAMRLPADFIGRFAMGGLARSINSGNKFAQGGQARSGNNVTFVIDRHKFAVTAGDDTVAALKRFSVASQLSSTGRKPSWVK